MKNLIFVIVAVVVSMSMTSCEKEEAVASYAIIQNAGTLSSGTYQMTSEGFSYVAVSKVVNIAFYQEYYKYSEWDAMPTYSCGNKIWNLGDTITVKSPNPHQLVKIEGEIIVL